jgi:hypothetical protein
VSESKIVFEIVALELLKGSYYVNHNEDITSLLAVRCLVHNISRAKPHRILTCHRVTFHFRLSSYLLDTYSMFDRRGLRLHPHLFGHTRSERSNI